MAQKIRRHILRKPYKGESKDHAHLEKDLHEDLKGFEGAVGTLDADLATAEADVIVAQAAADAKAEAQQDGAQKTTTGETFAPGASTWADLPGNSGVGDVSKAITTKGGKVKASLVVNLHSNNNADLFKIRIKQDGTGGNIEAATVTVVMGKKFILPVHEIFSPAAGSHTYTAQGWTDVAASEADIDMVDLTVSEIKEGS